MSSENQIDDQPSDVAWGTPILGLASLLAVASASCCVLLCPADGPVDHWTWRSLAGCSRAFHSLQNSHSHRRWACSNFGLVELFLSLE
jgi:hypothetical protein